MRKFGETKLADFQEVSKIGKFGINVGRGAFGQVFKGFDNKRKEWVAIKKVELLEENHGIPSTSLRQISLLREFQNQPNIVRLKDVITEQKNLFLIFEYLPLDLKQFLHNKREKQEVMSQQLVKKFLKQMLSAVSECHHKRVIHRDLKPANILIDQEHNLKVADFGLARTFSIPIRPYSQEVVTQWYRAPELLLECLEYSTEIDVWAIGCIFAEMATGRPLFPGESQSRQILRIFRTLGTPTEQNWPGVSKLKGYNIQQYANFQKKPLRQAISDLKISDSGLELLQMMLQYNPAARISAMDALHHKYFNE